LKRFKQRVLTFESKQKTVPFGAVFFEIYVIALVCDAQRQRAGRLFIVA
jgi:hypothetical protein